MLGTKEANKENVKELLESKEISKFVHNYLSLFLEPFKDQFDEQFNEHIIERLENNEIDAALTNLDVIRSNIPQDKMELVERLLNGLNFMVVARR